jgi:NAD(P)-dependent dehydrogenase (short-subunit alcohol dehydrogenase family)
MGILGGRVAVVTGAGGGLGRGHALLLAEEGAAVVLRRIVQQRNEARQFLVGGPAGPILARLSRPGRGAESVPHTRAPPELLGAQVDFAWPLRALPTVPRGDRELPITYLGHRRNCRYAVVQHAKFAARNGIDEQRLVADDGPAT